MLWSTAKKIGVGKKILLQNSALEKNLMMTFLVVGSHDKCAIGRFAVLYPSKKILYLVRQYKMSSISLLIAFTMSCGLNYFLY